MPPVDSYTFREVFSKECYHRGVDHSHMQVRGDHVMLNLLIFQLRIILFAVKFYDIIKRLVLSLALISKQSQFSILFISCCKPDRLCISKVAALLMLPPILRSDAVRSSDGSQFAQPPWPITIISYGRAMELNASCAVRYPLLRRIQYQYQS